jgi:hypothetical protein
LTQSLSLSPEALSSSNGNESKGSRRCTLGAHGTLKWRTNAVLIKWERISYFSDTQSPHWFEDFPIPARRCLKTHSPRKHSLAVSKAIQMHDRPLCENLRRGATLSGVGRVICGYLRHSAFRTPNSEFRIPNLFARSLKIRPSRMGLLRKRNASVPHENTAAQSQNSISTP